MRKKIGLVLFMILFCGVAAAPLAHSFKGTVTVGLPQEAPTMDPNITTNAIGFLLWGWAYDSLVKYDMYTKKFNPWLAEKWKRVGPTAYKFWLRKDAKFADGTPVTAEAVKLSMDRIQDPKLKSRQRRYYKAWKSFEIIDDHTFIWHLKWSDNGLLGLLNRAFLIINPKAKGKGKADIARNTYGGGAYVLKSWSKGTKMIFEPNPHWWGNSKYPNRPKKIIVRRILEQTTRVKALLTGEVDIIQGVAAHLLPQIDKHPKTRTQVVPAVRVFYLSFATKFGGPFADRNVRLAVNYAIDADKIRKSLVRGLADPFHSIYHPWTFSGHDPNIRWYGYDLAKAKAYMKKSAYPNGFKALYNTTRGRFAFDKQMGEAIAGMVKEIGIDMKVRASNFPLYRKTVISYRDKKQKLPGLMFRSWGNSFMDTTQVQRGTSSCGGPWSVACYPELDELNEKAAATLDLAKQHELFKKVTLKMKELAMHKILFKNKQAFGIRNSLKFKARGDDTMNPWDMVQTKATN
ncbi:ABC transporter substrate-binding protein [Nitrospinota bacterium]